MEQLRSVKMAERGKGKRNSRTMSAQGTRAVRSTAQQQQLTSLGQNFDQLCCVSIAVPDRGTVPQEHPPPGHGQEDE